MPPAVDPRKAAQRWADVWERSWHEHDADAIAALYAEGAFWQQHPFRPPEPGYLARVFLEEESAECQFGTPIVDGDQAQTKLVQVVLADHLARPISPLKDRHVESIGSS